jgi:L-fucose isomerase-like protein
MIKPKAGFVVYGVHKDGLCDPTGQPFIDAEVVKKAREALQSQGIEVAACDLVIATKDEARQVILPLAKDDTVDCLVLFSGTWVWAAHLIAAVREFAKTGKGIVIWTCPGSQGWRPVGGLVLKAALKEIGIMHRFIYGHPDDPAELAKVVSYVMAAAVKNRINMTTLMAFGGRGMGQTCGAADPSQWMKVFGIDIDSRDTTELLKTADSVTDPQIQEIYQRINVIFRSPPEDDPVTERSIRLYAAMKLLMAKHGFSYYTVQSYPGLADDYAASCFMQSMMLEDGVPTSTLSDYNTCLTSILIQYFSGERTYYGDFQNIDRARKEIKIIGDGAIPPSLANEAGVEFARHGIPTEGSAGGLSINLTCKAGRGVLGRICRVDGQFRLVVARCKVDVPSETDLTVRRSECGIPFWPHAFVTVDCDIDQLLENWDNEYACLGYGEQLYSQLLDFAELTGIEAIAL